MKRIAIIIFTFCALLIMGCRTSKSVETIGVKTDERLFVVEKKLTSAIYDSLRKRLVLTADSIMLEWPIPLDSGNVTDMPRSKVKAYGIRIKARQEQTIVAQKDSTETEAKARGTTELKGSKRVKQTTKSPISFSWLIAVFLFGTILFVIYRLRTR